MRELRENQEKGKGVNRGYGIISAHVRVHLTHQWTCTRYPVIPLHLHISELYTDNRPYYAKVEPLLSHVLGISQSLYIPSLAVAVDEMVVGFCGHSAHTFRIKNKPTPEGYKIYSLCDRGYTYAALPVSRIQESKEVKKIPGITATGNIVLHLVHQLPYRRKTFNIYMDNFFSSIPLFSYLRRKNIGACGTVRTNS